MSPISKSKKLYALIVFAVLLFAGVLIFENSGAGSAFLWNISGEGRRLLPLVVGASLIDSINPCAFSILLLTIAFLFSIGKLRQKVLGIGLAYILGLFMVYLLIGLGLLQVLHLFNTPHFMAKVGSGLLIILGVINVIGHFFPRFPVKLKIPQAAHRQMAVMMDRASIPAAFLLGALVGLCEFPCTGGPYLMVLGLLHDSATYVKGFGYLVLYNLLFVLPLLVILFVASNKIILDRVQNWQREKSGSMHLYSGIIMILLGIIVYLL